MFLCYPNKTQSQYPDRTFFPELAIIWQMDEEREANILGPLGTGESKAGPNSPWSRGEGEGHPVPPPHKNIVPGPPNPWKEAVEKSLKRRKRQAVSKRDSS